MEGVSVVPSRSDTRADQVYWQIRLALLSGAMPAGQRMTTRGLAEEMNVSGTPAREALGRLVAEGALDFGPNRTVQVPLLTASQVDEIYDARILLEGQLIEAAVPNRSTAQVVELENIHSQHVEAIGRRDYRTCVRLNFEFKFTMYKAAKRPITLRIIEGLWLRTGPHVHFVYPQSADNEIFARLHRDAIEGMKVGDVIRVKSAILRDLMEAQARLRVALAALQTSRTPKKKHLQK
jgi:DNA-binding GntR family transcriptional regulator